MKGSNIQINIDDINFEDALETQKYKQSLVMASHDFAMDGDTKKVQALKSQMEIVISMERNQQVVREQRLSNLEDILDGFEVQIATLTAQNAKLRMEVASAEQTVNHKTKQSSTEDLF